MKWFYDVDFFVVAVLIMLFEWPKLKKQQRKEKMALISLLVISIGLAMMLLYFPGIPGPTELVVKVFQPLGRILEKS